jgi:hypothetical protein
MVYGSKVILAAVPSLGGIIELPGHVLPNHDGDDAPYDYGANHDTPIYKPPPIYIHYYDANMDRWSRVYWNLDGVHFMTRIKHAWIIEDNDSIAIATGTATETSRASLMLSSRVSVILIGHHAHRGDTQWIKHFDSVQDLISSTPPPVVAVVPSPTAATAVVIPASPTSPSSPTSPNSGSGSDDIIIPVPAPRASIHRDGDNGWQLIRSFCLMSLDFTIKDFTLA